MIEYFDFTIYTNLPTLEKNGKPWYIAAFYDFEFEYIKSIFKENIDYIIFEEWEINEGYDVLINSKIYTWLSLCYGIPEGDEFTSNIHNHFTEIQNKLYETNILYQKN